MYDFYLGGTAYSAVDRAAAEQVTSLMPEVIDGAWANRGFLQRAVRRMATELGVRQFIDVGAGLPTQRNTHDVLADVTPDGRVIYVDIDPAAMSRANRILTGVAGAVAIRADIRDPDAILDHPDTRRLIDFAQPVGLLLVAVLHFIPDVDDPWSLVARYLAAVPSGSYLALSHGSGDQVTERMREAGLKLYAATTNPATERTRTEIARFFDGLEIVPPYQGAEPEVTFTGLWGAEDPASADSDGSRLSYAALGRKP
jgi:hypothetical protein